MKNPRYYEGENFPGYSSPILGSIFHWVGIIDLAVGTCMVLVFPFIIASSQAGWGESSVAPIFAGIAVILGSIIPFGIAQLLEHIAKAAYYAEKQASLMEQRNIDAAREAASLLNALSPQKTATPAAPDRVRTKRFFYQLNGAEIGPVTEAALQRLANEGRIDADTYIRPEHADEWRRLEKMLANA